MTAAYCAPAKEVGFLFIVFFDVINVAGADFLVLVVVDVLGAVPQAITVILVDCPAAILLVLFVFVRPLAAAEAS